VPDVVEWARQNPSKVQVVVFIAFRTATDPRRFDYYVGSEKVDPGRIYRGGPTDGADVSSSEIAGAIAQRFPLFQPAAYLNGTERPDSLKWLMTPTVNDGEEILGSIGPKVIELAQVASHLWRGRYLGYVHRDVMAKGRSLLALWAIDGGVAGGAALGRQAGPEPAPRPTASSHAVSHGQSSRSM
jgi:hypothetical protein